MSSSRNEEVREELSLSQWAKVVLAPLDLAPARHHEFLLAELEALDRGEVERLMVLMPPGSAKSTYASILFPPWWLARHPRGALIACSHTAALASYFGRRVRSVIREHGTALGVRFGSESRAAARFETTEAAEYFAAGVRGPITGRRADLVLIDDPIKSWAEADSATARAFVWEWFRADLSPRLKPHGRMALIMTRWHEDDLAGRILAHEGPEWRLLRLPAVAEPADLLGRALGDPLWPEWESAERLAHRRLRLGERAFAALYQQSPRPDTGNLFNPRNLVLVDSVPEAAASVRGWDLASAVPAPGCDPDWTVGAKLVRDVEGRFVIADIQRFRRSVGEVERAIVAAAEADGRHTVIALPQDPGQAGRAQVLYLTRRLAGFIVEAGVESGAKATRSMPLAAQCDAGNLYVQRAPWNSALIEELASFPHSRHDDQVDALARAFTVLIKPKVSARRLSVPLFER